MAELKEHPLPTFVFFADLVDKEVLDSRGQSVGKLFDIAFSPGEHYPKATHLVISRGLFRRKRYAKATWDKVDSIYLSIRLKSPKENLAFQAERPQFNFTLRRDILDQQVVDTKNHKVIRVNDAHLLLVDHEVRLAHLDVGIRGIIRRLGWLRAADRMIRLLFPKSDYFRENFIQWKYVQPLSVNPKKDTLRLSVPESQLAQIPHDDFRDILLDLDIYERLALFRTLKPEIQAGVFDDFELPAQTEIIENLEVKEAVSILSRIPADQATDILEDLPRSVADKLLTMMETSTAKKLSTLLGYTSDSAGGIMTTEMVTMPADATVKDVIERLKKTPEALDTCHFVYLVEEQGRLAAMVPIRRLTVADAKEPASNYALPKPVYARIKDGLREVAYAVEKYRLPAIPVVNNGKDRVLQGVITVDDIMERLIPIAWRRRAKKATPG